MRSVRLLPVALVIAAGCSRGAPPPPAEGEGKVPAYAPKPAPPDAQILPNYRTPESDDHVDPTVAGSGKTYLVVSESDQATKVGKDILAGGGNAVDAAIATAFALAVTHPTAGNLGGGGFAVVRVASGKVVSLDFRETAPAAATETMYLDKDGKPTKDSTVGHKASGVPGSVAGLWALHQKLGKKPWKELLEPAITLARDGFKVDEQLHKSIVRRAEKLLLFPKTAEIWVPGRVPKESGATVAIPQLAVALERIRDAGPDGFYKGETAKAIVDEMKTGGGIITAADLAGYQPVWRDPLKFTYRGNTLWSMGPPSSGGIVLAMTAGILERFDLGKLEWHGADHVHLLTEVWRRAFAARNELVGDPAFVKNIPVDTLIGKPYLDKLAATITASPTPSKEVVPFKEGDNTTHLCVVDAQGQAVSLTTTLNTAWGSAVTVHGFLLNNEMDDFTAKPGSPNAFGLVQGIANKIEPGKRMLSSMSPTIVEDAKGELRLVVGAQGGPRIITAVWQTLSNAIDFGKPAASAVSLPRLHHQHLPDRVEIEEDSVTHATNETLKALGYPLDYNHTTMEFGSSSLIERTPTGWEGAADPRGGGAAMGD